MEDYVSQIDNTWINICVNKYITVQLKNLSHVLFIYCNLSRLIYLLEYWLTIQKFKVRDTIFIYLIINNGCLTFTFIIITATNDILKYDYNLK